LFAFSSETLRATLVKWLSVTFFRMKRLNPHCSQVFVMEKAIQKYLLMIKLSPNMAAKLYEPLMEYNEKPMEGVKLEEAYQVFGEWDFAVLFQADTNANALHFVGDKIRLIEGVVETFTIPLAPIKDYRK
jgi:uncharacterized protein with GYD domain